MTDHVATVQAAAVDRALVAADPALARRHLALVAALEPLRGDPGTHDRLATGAAALLAVRAATEASSDERRPAGTPELPSPDSPTAHTGNTAALAADGAAIAHRRHDAAIARLADRADLTTPAVRAALARR